MTPTTTDEFEDGYRLGWHTGYDVGRAHGIDEESAAWSSILTGCTEVWRQPRHDEVLALRNQPASENCPRDCGRCSRCVAAEAWRRRGGRPYLGTAGERAA